MKKTKTILILYILLIFLANNTLIVSAKSLNNQIDYNGKIEHLSFTTLMAFPEKALDPQNNNNSIFDNTKITPYEFQNILEELYKNNYVLIDIKELFFVESNTIYTKTLYLPKNKKPIILSFDNVSYKSSYQNLGEVDKIIIDRNNQFATYTTKKSIQDRVMHDNEFIPLLESFIEHNPDFSYNNARGIIFLTGENGILGYETNQKNTNTKHETKRVAEIITKLKHKGWSFGCNNYRYLYEDTLSDLDFARDLSLWQKEIKSIIGETILYAYPYGQHDITNTTKQKTLLDNNFKVFFTNSMSPSLIFNNNTLTMTRKPVNGVTLRNNSKEFADLFNSENVYDHTHRNIPFHQLNQ